MATNALLPLTFTDPPADYDQAYWEGVLRDLEVYIEQTLVPGPARNTTITLTDLPTSPTDLEPGAVYRDGDKVRIVPPAPDDDD